MKSFIIKNGLIIDPEQIIEKTGNIVIADGRISKLSFGKSIAESGANIIDAKGMVVCPGFIDLHCHLRDPGFPDKETIATGSRAAAKGGFTTICCMPNTNPPLDGKETIDYVKSTALKDSPVRVLLIGCITQGRDGKKLANLEELARAGLIGFSDDGSSVMDSAILRQALEFSRVSNLPVMEHCEDASLARGGEMNEGATSKRLGLVGVPAAAEEIIVARDIMLAELTGGWLHICHASTRGTVDLIRQAKAKGIRVTAEATPHHLVLDESVVRSNDADSKVNPPLRTRDDVRALVEGLKEGVIDIIATDHAPHTPSEKAKGFKQAPSGFSVFETALGSLMHLVSDKSFTLPELISKMTSEPAKLLGGKYGINGTLAPGAEADIVIFDPDKEWVVDVSEFISKGKNTPLKGTTLKGKVMATVAGGKIVYRDSSVKLEGTI